MLGVLLCLCIILRDTRLVLPLAYKSAIRILVMAQCKTAKGHGLQERQANDERAQAMTRTHQREIHILQAYRTRQMHDKTGWFWFEGTGRARECGAVVSTVIGLLLGI